MDTNSISQIAQAAPQVQSALNAWHLVALGAGAYLAHAYHSIKAAGGIKNIFRGLWDGDPQISQISQITPENLRPSVSSADRPGPQRANRDIGVSAPSTLDSLSAVASAKADQP